MSYGSGIDANEVTSGPPRVYLVVYGSQWGAASTDPSGDMAFSADKMGELPRLQSFFKGLGTGGELWSGTMTQYCDGPGISFGDTACPDNASHVGYPASVVLAGIWYDNSAGSPRISTGHQLAAEAVSAAKFFGNTTPESNRYAQYVILSPPGTNPDGWNSGSGFCAWHDYNGDKELDGGAAPSDFGDIAFTNMPYVSDAGLECGANFVNSGPSGMIDGVTIVEGHEYAETITDQKPLGGWANRTGYAAYVGGENADVCAWTKSGQGAAANVTMGNGSYALQSTWSNDTARCDISHTVWHKLPTPTPTPTCVDVPDVTDSFADNAVNILTAASFIVVKQSRPGTTTNLHDAVVYRESPASGKCIKKGSKVTISIENGPVP